MHFIHIREQLDCRTTVCFIYLISQVQGLIGCLALAYKLVHNANLLFSFAVKPPPPSKYKSVKSKANQHEIAMLGGRIKMNSHVKKASRTYFF